MAFGGYPAPHPRGIAGRRRGAGPRWSTTQSIVVPTSARPSTARARHTGSLAYRILSREARPDKPSRLSPRRWFAERDPVVIGPTLGVSAAVGPVVLAGHGHTHERVVTPQRADVGTVDGTPVHQAPRCGFERWHLTLYLPTIRASPLCGTSFTRCWSWREDACRRGSTSRPARGARTEKP